MAPPWPPLLKAANSEKQLPATPHKQPTAALLVALGSWKAEVLATSWQQRGRPPGSYLSVPGVGVGWHLEESGPEVGPLLHFWGVGTPSWLPFPTHSQGPVMVGESQGLPLMLAAA